MKEVSVSLKDVFANVVMTVAKVAAKGGDKDRDSANAILAAFECGFAYDFPKEFMEYRKKANAVFAKHLPDLVKWSEGKADKEFGDKFTPEQLAERVGSGSFADATRAAVVCTTLLRSNGDTYGILENELADAYGDKAKAEADTEASMKETALLFAEVLGTIADRPAPMSSVCFSVACAVLNADPDRIKTLAGDASGNFSSMDAASFDAARAMLLPAVCVRAMITAGAWVLDGTVSVKRGYVMVDKLGDLLDRNEDGDAMMSLFGPSASTASDCVKRAQLRDFVMDAGHASVGDSTDVLSFLSSIPKKPSEVSGDAVKALVISLAKSKDFRGKDAIAKLAESSEGKTAQEFLASMLKKINGLPGEMDGEDSEKDLAMYAFNWLLAYRYFEDESELMDFASERFKDLGSQVLARVKVVTPDAKGADDEGGEEGADGEEGYGGFKS